MKPRLRFGGWWYDGEKTDLCDITCSTDWSINMISRCNQVVYKDMQCLSDEVYRTCAIVTVLRLYFGRSELRKEKRDGLDLSPT